MANGGEAINALLGIGGAVIEPEPLPTFEGICLDLPLYSPQTVSDTAFMETLREGNFQFDAHCVDCGRSSTFRTARQLNKGTGHHFARDANWMLQPAEIRADLICQRYTSHRYHYLFVYRAKQLTKFGQRPSLEDIAGADIRQYEKVMPEGYFSELKRAGGLASHGIGIGSFVYLRRIFEKLIAAHHAELTAPIEGFDGMRIDEKIGALRDHLPPALVENKAAYGILSTGIHELSEDACRAYFPVVRQAIITILDQDLQARTRNEQAEKLRKEIAAIAGAVQAAKDTKKGSTG